MVWLYLIQLYVEITPMGCPLDLCTSMQRHLCTLKEVPPTPTPSLIVI
jgi:hypothetical protein